MKKPLTGSKRFLFLQIARYPDIAQSSLCACSRFRGGEVTRVNHHLIGLESEGFIKVAARGKRGSYRYRITTGKGEKMLRSLQEFR
ncbi:hypothetical protein [Microcystis sp.]|uniref:hypothetical protein n=1 Tax=Microcystis sp. TaxID=1127 RepID=UPI003AF922F0